MPRYILRYTNVYIVYLSIREISIIIISTPRGLYRRVRLIIAFLFPSLGIKIKIIMLLT